MAKRKAVSKLKNFGGRKATSESSSSVKEQKGGNARENTNELNLASSKKTHNYCNVNDHTRNYQNRTVVDSSSHRQDNRIKSSYNTNTTIVPTTATTVTKKEFENTVDTSSNNNVNLYNTTSISTSSNDLKYLHKKFKRIASATLNEFEQSKQQSNNHVVVQTNYNLSNTAVTSSSSLSKPITGLVYETNLNKNSDSLKLSYSSPVREIEFNNSKIQQQNTLVNGGIQNSSSSSSSLLSPLPSSTKIITTIESDYTVNNSDIEYQTNVLNNCDKISFQKLNQIRTSTSLLDPDNVSEIKGNNNLIDSLNISSSSHSVQNTNNTSASNETVKSSNSSASTLMTFINTNNQQKFQQKIQQNSQNQSTQGNNQRQQQQRSYHCGSGGGGGGGVGITEQNSGRYECFYCNMICTKPSALKKHIRAHTNERPYPCDTCGFAFKTKSNYYKHCRSRSHALRIKGEEMQTDEENSIESDQDLSNSSSDVASETSSLEDERMPSPHTQQQSIQSFIKSSSEKPYKPKFHNAALYAVEDFSKQKQQKQQEQSNQERNLLQHKEKQQKNEQYQYADMQSSYTSLYPSSNYLYNLQYQQQKQLTQEQNEKPSSSTQYSHKHIENQMKSHYQESISNIQTTCQQILPLCTESMGLSSMDSTNNTSTYSCTLAPTGMTGHQLNFEFLQERISKIISQNEAIVENKELLLQKKYPKISSRSKNNSDSLLAVTKASADHSKSNILPSQSLSFSINKIQNVPQSSQQLNTLQTNIFSSPQCDEDFNVRRIDDGCYTFANNETANNLSVPSSLLHINHQIVNHAIHHPIEFPSTIQQPLNLSKLGEQNDQSFSTKKKQSIDYSGSIPLIVEPHNFPKATKGIAIHPQNPERSIIKHLLLNARGLGVPNGEGDDAIFTCPLCKMDFRSAEELKLHTSNYCQGRPSSAPISPVASPSHKYFRSNSFNVNLPEFNNPNSLAKLARSSLLHLSRNPLSLAKLAWSQLKTKPSNLVLSQLNVNTSTMAGSSSSHIETGKNVNNGSSNQKFIDTPLPSPGPLLGKTPLIDSYNNNYPASRKSDDVVITKVHDEDKGFNKEYSSKKQKFNNYNVPSSQETVPIPVTCNINLPTLLHPNHIISEEYAKLFQRQSVADTSTPIINKPPSYAMCGGEVKLIERREGRMKRCLSSGGCVISVSDSSEIEPVTKMIRTPLFSGGSFAEIPMATPVPVCKSKILTSITPTVTQKMASSTISLPLTNLLSSSLPLAQNCQFPPINSITAFNPLTLPPVTSSSVMSSTLHGEKLVPFVLGIPGPNTLSPSSILLASSQKLVSENKNINSDLKRNLSLTLEKSDISNFEATNQYQHSVNVLNSLCPQLQKPVIHIEPETTCNVINQISSADITCTSQENSRNWSHVSSTRNEKIFNFARMADNLSPKETNVENILKLSESDNGFESAKPGVISSPGLHRKQPQQKFTPLNVDVVHAFNDEKLNVENKELETEAEVRRRAKSKFLRPTSLPLKPGTFTPKIHHGITPTANTLPLISPETPRPSKACLQLYLNGHAYTYLGLKCSTKMFYCTVNCPQPSYKANLHQLSMYSVWQVCAEYNPHPLGLKPKTVISLYDSRQKSSVYSVANINCPYVTVHSQDTITTPYEKNVNNQYQYHYYHNQNSAQTISSDVLREIEANEQTVSSSNVFVGGYESNEDYTYIRGRGRGRYVCSECGIRCRKPSMLKEHIRTHTDVRPYTCSYCCFSFKTKGNLTKHMMSKAHYKKCLELGVNPEPFLSDNDQLDIDSELDQQSVDGDQISSFPGESESDDYSDGDEEGEIETSDKDESKSRLLEHEAAKCLLSLSMTSPRNSASPQTFQYKLQNQTQKSVESSQIVDKYHQQSTVRRKMTNDNQNQFHSYQESRRVVPLISPKIPHDYYKQDQYYSNPNIIPKNKDNIFDESNMTPIDLTKPRQTSTEQPQKPTTPQTTVAQQKSRKISEIVKDFSNESVLLKSLIMNTDKIRETTPFTSEIPNAKMDENSLLQAYLTEQALKYIRIKQSQMNKSFDGVSVPYTYATSNVAMENILTPSIISSTQKSGNIENYKQDKFQLCQMSNSENEMTKMSQKSIKNSEIISNDNTVSSVENNLKMNTASCLTSTTEQLTSDKNISDHQELQKPEITFFHEINHCGTSLQQSSSQSEVVCSNVKSQIQHDRQPEIDNMKTVSSEKMKVTVSESEKSKSRFNRLTDESEESSSDGQDISSGENCNNANNTLSRPPSDFTGILARTVIVGEDGFKSSSNEVQPMFPRVPISDDGRPVCTICSKTFQKQHQMVLHMNIHYMERKFKCEPCAVSYRTQGLLQKHERSEGHKNKVMMTSTFGVPTTSNPRPFGCSDCKVAFRIHGHLAKHLRSKTHVQKLECLQKLPFGTYAEIERAGISLTEIDTTDCDNSLTSLKVLAQKLIEKDPNKLSMYSMEGASTGLLSQESGSEDNNSSEIPAQLIQMNTTLSQNVGNEESTILPVMPSKQAGLDSAISSSNITGNNNSNSGIKRKFDSFSSCSDDSVSNITNELQQQQQRKEFIVFEKRVKTSTDIT